MSIDCTLLHPCILLCISHTAIISKALSTATAFFNIIWFTSFTSDILQHGCIFKRDAQTLMHALYSASNKIWLYCICKVCNVHHPPHCAAASSGASPPMHLPRIGCRGHCCASAAAANTIGNNCTKCIFQCNFTLHCMLSNNKRLHLQKKATLALLPIITMATIAPRCIYQCNFIPQ